MLEEPRRRKEEEGVEEFAPSPIKLSSPQGPGARKQLILLNFVASLCVRLSLHGRQSVSPLAKLGSVGGNPTTGTATWLQSFSFLLRPPQRSSAS